MGMHTDSRPNETEVMMLLELIVATVTEAQGYIQNDGRISGPSDRKEISDRLRHIRALTLEIEHVVNP